MISSYLKIAWRNIIRNKFFSTINVVGLAIGMACSVFIFLWVFDELSFDTFHKNYGTTYRVMAHRNFNNNLYTDQNMPLPLGFALQKELPEVKQAVVSTNADNYTIAYGDTRLNKKGYTASNNFFNLFTFSFLNGNAATALSDPTSVVITESTAKALFGNSDPLDKVIQYDSDKLMKVTAVVADPPANSSLQFDFVKPFNFSDEQVKAGMNEWRNSSFNVYLQAVPNTNETALGKAIDALKKSHDPSDKVSTFFAFAMKDWRLHSDFKDGKNVGGQIQYVRMFTFIAIIILLIACVNFMNLSTARSESRAREVGIRKTLGSERRALIFQFIAEAMVMAFIAFVFAIVAVLLLMPVFNNIVHKQLSLPVLTPLFWLGALAIIVLTGIVAGSYPALYLSSFKPARVLKGSSFNGQSTLLPRRVLVVLQFVISIVFISATIVVYQQIKHAKSRGTGYNPNNLVMVPASGDANKNYAIIKQILLSSGTIEAVTRTFSPITEVWWKSPAPGWKGKPENLDLIFTGYSADADFAKTLGITLLEGSDFAGTPADSSSILINKAAVEAMGLTNALGMQLTYGKKDFVVKGITDNIIMESPFDPVNPMMIFYNFNGNNSISIRLKDGVQPTQALPVIERTFTQYNPSIPFEYHFADEAFQEKFVNEKLVSNITNIFAGLAIIICCLGLAGLASFTIEKRKREIGIRKVLGASVHQLLFLVSREFIQLVLIALLIAVPVAWLLMNNWLNQYTYRVSISGLLFVIVGAAVLLLALAVVGANTLRTALRNPVSSLRNE